MKLFQEIIKEYSNNKKITPIIVIDEANYLSRTLLNDLKMLFNFEMDSIDNYVLILAKLPTLVSNLSSASQTLRQEIITSFSFETLSGDEAKAYIFGKLEKASGATNIFDEGVMQSIINCSNGVPRVIDRIMDYALLIADKMNSTIITKTIIQKAIEQASL